MVTNICVLRSGGDFKPEHVVRLSKQVKDLVCLSDVEIEGVKTIPLQYDWPHWWAKMELYRPDIQGDLLYFDLDTLVINMPPIPERDCVLRDFGDSGVIGSGMMYLTEYRRSVIWKAWIQDPNKAMSSHVAWPSGDQGFIFPYLRNALRWQNITKVYSWKYHCAKGIPADADVVCFHGKPRPWDVGL